MSFPKYLENFLRKYDDLIDNEHQIFFYSMLNELRPCLSEPFIYSSIGLHKKDCHFADNSYKDIVDICNCISLYSRYKTLKKIYNLYAVMFKEPRWL